MEAVQSPLQQTLQEYLQRLHPKAAAQIKQHLAAFAAGPDRAAFFRLFALTPRWTGRQPMAPSAAEREALATLHPNLAHAGWDDDQLARLWILCAVQDNWPAERFARELETLFNTGDTAELVALYRCLALLRKPRQFHARAREGARSNMVSVFQAIAHHNSYPAQYFDAEGWNQLVLKAIFTTSALDAIVGLDQRNNPALAHMLSDYVRERWAAGRDVPWDIWRCIGPHAWETGDQDLLAAALQAQDGMTRRAAAMALVDSGAAEAAALLQARPEVQDSIANLDWHGLEGIAQGD